MKFDRILVIVFLISLLINLFGIWWGLPNYYNWSSDDLTPNAPLSLASNMFHLNSRYPPFHYALLDFFYAPYLCFSYLSGGLVNPGHGFPYGFTDPLSSLTVLMLISRFVSSVMGGLAVVFVYLGVKSLYGKKAAFFSALSVAFSYVFIVFSHLGNLDVPCVFWFSVTLYFYARLIKSYKFKYYVLLGVFAAIAIATKDQILGFFVLLPLPLIYLHVRFHRKKGLKGFKSLFFNKKLVYCLLAFILSYAFFSNVIFDFSGFSYRFNYWYSGEGTDSYAQFSSGFEGQLGLFQDFLSQLSFSVGPALIYLFVTAFVFCILNLDSYKLAFLLPLISYYIFDIGRIHYLYYRMTIPIIIVLAYFLGALISKLFKLFEKRILLYFVLGFLFLCSFLYGLSADLNFVFDSRHSAEKWMVNNMDKGKSIEVYQDGSHLPRFHALGFENVYQVFFEYEGYEKPPVLLFEPVLTSPDIEELKERSPDYIVLSDCCYNITNFSPERLEYFNSINSGEAGYKLVKKFENKILFSPKTPFLLKRVNVPVKIFEKANFIN